MKIDVIIDVVCPWCFVGKRELDRALAARPNIDVEVTYLPYQLAPHTPQEGVDRASYYKKKFGDGSQLATMREHLHNKGAALGISFDFESDCNIANTMDAHRLIRWAKAAGCQSMVADAIMEAYFEQSAFIGDHELLSKIAGSAGMDVELVSELLASDRDVSSIKDEIERVQNMGIQGVPFFIFDEKSAVSGAQSSEALVQVMDKLS